MKEKDMENCKCGSKNIRTNAEVALYRLALQAENKLSEKKNGGNDVSFLEHFFSKVGNFIK